MPRKKARLGKMKSSNVNMRVSDELRPVLDYLKMLPGGISGWFEARLREVEVDRDLYAKLKKLK